MKCRVCQTEMLIDSTEIDGDAEIFHYLCKNPDCPNYGYQKRKEPAPEKPQAGAEG